MSLEIPLQHLISAVPNRKVTWSTFCCYFTFSPRGHGKNNTNPIPHLIQLWESNEIMPESAVKTIKHCENVRPCYWYYREGLLQSLLFFPSSWIVITSNSSLTTSDSYLSWKMCTGFRASFRKTITSMGSFIFSLSCCVYGSFAYCSSENWIEISCTLLNVVNLI